MKVDGKFVIEIYKSKTSDELTELIAMPDSKPGAGSANAAVAAYAAALLLRAARLTAQGQEDDEKLQYIIRNAEILRKYMVHLVDEDVKCHSPLRRALKEGQPSQIEAARKSSIGVSGEIINMMGKCLELLQQLKEPACEPALPFMRQSAHIAMAAAESAMEYNNSVAADSADETFRFVVPRENQITLEQYKAMFNSIAE